MEFEDYSLEGIRLSPFEDSPLEELSFSTQFSGPWFELVNSQSFAPLQVSTSMFTPVNSSPSLTCSFQAKFTPLPSVPSSPLNSLSKDSFLPDDFEPPSPTSSESSSHSPPNEDEQKKNGRAKIPLGPSFKKEVKEKCQGFAEFGEEEFEPWPGNLSWIYKNRKSPQGFEKLVQGYRHRKTGTDLVVIYQRKVKRLGQKVKSALNFISSEEEKSTHPDRDLFFKPLRLTAHKTLALPYLGPIRKFLAPLSLSSNPTLFKAQGEHIANHLKLLIAEFPNEEMRAAYFQGMLEK